MSMPHARVPSKVSPDPPPPSYDPSHSGPNGRDLSIVVHQQELKITHEHVVAPPAAGHIGVEKVSYQSKQPTATVAMAVKAGDRNVRGMPVIPGKGRAWSSTLCGFGDLCGTCEFHHG